eukprot:TRINITY_DN9116_c0_g1_i1.p1 TRINITY_DN9116_c0_g1~~TRINITY_DN9116_c0_g1_i1.p1  ORF type:complete len:111 (+),score=10.30 TRINITY_DN9116_c0_g1_i1:586-918(+)
MDAAKENSGRPGSNHHQTVQLPYRRPIIKWHPKKAKPRFAVLRKWSRRAVDKTASRIERLNLCLLQRNQCIIKENKNLRRQALLLSEENELLQKKLQEQVLFHLKSSGSK